MNSSNNQSELADAEVGLQQATQLVLKLKAEADKLADKLAKAEVGLQQATQLVLKLKAKADKLAKAKADKLAKAKADKLAKAKADKEDAKQKADAAKQKADADEKRCRASKHKAEVAKQKADVDEKRCRESKHKAEETTREAELRSHHVLRMETIREEEPRTQHVMTIREEELMPQHVVTIREADEKWRRLAIDAFSKKKDLSSHNLNQAEINSVINDPHGSKPGIIVNKVCVLAQYDDVEGVFGVEGHLTNDQGEPVDLCFATVKQNIDSGNRDKQSNRKTKGLNYIVAQLRTKDLTKQYTMNRMVKTEYIRTQYGV